MRYKALWQLKTYIVPMLPIVIISIIIMGLTGFLEMRTMWETQHVFRPIFDELQSIGTESPEDRQKRARETGERIGGQKGAQWGGRVGRKIGQEVAGQLAEDTEEQKGAEIGQKIGRQYGEELATQLGKQIAEQVVTETDKREVKLDQQEDKTSIWHRITGALGMKMDRRKPVSGSLTREQVMEHLYHASGRLFAFFMAAAVATAISLYMGQYVSQRLLLTLRREVFSHLQSLSLGFFEGRETGELISKINNDTQLLQDLLGRSLTRLVVAPITILSCVAAMLAISPLLTGIVAVMVPVILGANSVIGNKVRKYSRQVRERFADLTSAISETFHGMRVVKIFGMEPLTYDRFEEENEGVFRYTLRATRMRAGNRVFVGGLTGAAVCAALLFGAHEVGRGHTDAAGLMTFVLLMQTAASRVSHIARINLHFQRAEAAAQRLIDLLAEKTDVKEPQEPVAPDEINGRITFENVTFAYDQDEQVLHDISLQIEPGEAVALVGASGAGKSTVANLVARLYDINEGTVRIDDIDVRNLDPDTLKNNMGIVPQEIILFSASVKENIEYGRPGASDEEIIEAARAANAHQFITELPEGYDTQVGEQGAKLSGGQRQRVAIARALLRNPPILILDEATSSLDAESEATIHEALETLVAERTTIIIAHRLSTVTNADRIVVIDKGSIVEQGTHEQLLQKDGVYRRLYEKGTFSAPSESQLQAGEQTAQDSDVEPDQKPSADQEATDGEGA